jgi:hypothetical protein
MLRPLDARLWAKIKDWSEDQIYEWEERAAIIEFDGGSPRVLAEQEAYRQITQSASQRDAGCRSPCRPDQSCSQQDQEPERKRQQR